jgi:hypothetical protein
VYILDLQLPYNLGLKSSEDRMVPEKLSLMLFKVDKNIPYDIVVRRLEIVRLPDKQYSDMADVETQLVAKSKDPPYFSLIVGLLFYRQSFLTY